MTDYMAEEIDRLQRKVWELESQIDALKDDADSYYVQMRAGEEALVKVLHAAGYKKTEPLTCCNALAGAIYQVFPEDHLAILIPEQVVEWVANDESPLDNQLYFREVCRRAKEDK